MGAGETKGDAMGREEITEESSNKLATIITLNAMNRQMKLVRYKDKKTLKHRGCFRFIS